MIKFIFDMDGTIVDSQKAVRIAYKKAGLVVPEDAWGKTAREWDCPPDIHEMKCRLYPAVLLSTGRRMHAADFLETVHGSVITGAGLPAVEAVRKFLRHDFPLVGHSCTHEMKMDVLRSEAAIGGITVFYVDDDLDFGKRALYEIDNLQFLAIARHEGVYHLHNKKGEVQRWTLSFWLPDATIV